MQFRIAMLSVERIVAIWIGIGLLLAATQADAAACRARVPKTLLTYAEHETGSWRLAELRDLRADDQKLWRKMKHGSCPSVATANFDGTGRPQFALLLLSVNSKVRLIHAVRERTGRFSTRVLYEGESAVTPVVFAGRPGNYSDAEQVEHHTLLFPPIIFSVLEAGATAYYFADHTIHELPISE